MFSLFEANMLDNWQGADIMYGPVLFFFFGTVYHYNSNIYARSHHAHEEIRHGFSLCCANRF